MTLDAAKPVSFNSARFLVSAARLAECPPDAGREVAFAGRSNAGKSSAINCITANGKLARTRHPNTALIAAAMKEAPKLSRYEASTRGSIVVCQNCFQLIIPEWMNTVDSGMSTRMPR